MLSHKIKLFSASLFCVVMLVGVTTEGNAQDSNIVSWRKTAEQGDADAQFNLGNAYHTGAGVEKDDKQAVIWYRKAAEQGNADAQSNLGLAYHNGTGVEKDDKEAVNW